MHVTCECVYMHDVCVLYMRSFWLACISDVMCKVCLTGASKGLRAKRLRWLCCVLRCDTGMMLSIRDAVSCIPVCLLCGMVRLIQSFVRDVWCDCMCLSYCHVSLILNVLWSCLHERCWQDESTITTDAAQECSAIFFTADRILLICCLSYGLKTGSATTRKGSGLSW